MAQRGRPGRSASRGQQPVEYLAGRNSVREALFARRRAIQRVIVAHGTEASGTLGDILALAEEGDITVEYDDRNRLDQLSEGVYHQGVVAETSSYPYVELDDCLARASELNEMPFLLALDSVQDPQNVGSLLRTAEAVGVHGVIIPGRRSASITPAVSRASVGAVEHLLIANVTNLTRTLNALKAQNLWVVGVEGLAEAQEYDTVDLAMPLVLVLGSEGQGMGRLVSETCDILVRLPMRGQVTSLNVSVAGSIVLYRALEMRQAHK